MIQGEAFRALSNCSQQATFKTSRRVCPSCSQKLHSAQFTAVFSFILFCLTRPGDGLAAPWEPGLQTHRTLFPQSSGKGGRCGGPAAHVPERGVFPLPGKLAGPLRATTMTTRMQTMFMTTRTTTMTEDDNNDNDQRRGRGKGRGRRRHFMTSWK